MENPYELTVAITIVALIILLVILLRQNKKQKKLILFLDGVDRSDKFIKSTRFLKSLGVKNINKYGYKLIPFYQDIFCLATIMHIPALVNKISQYIERLNKLPNSKEKQYLIDIFRQAILNGDIEGLAFIIYYSIKIKHRDRNEDGERVITFLLANIDDVNSYSIDSLIDKINFYEKCEPVLSVICREEIRKNLNEIINNLKK